MGYVKYVIVKKNVYSQTNITYSIMEIYCVKCKRKTDTDNINQVRAKNNRKALTGSCKCGTKKYPFMSNKVEGSNLDIHRLIGKLPLRPEKGFAAPSYNYLGPYNPLDKQVSFNKQTGDIQKIHVLPQNALVRIAMHHDICYTVNPPNKRDCNRKMVRSIDEIPYKDMNKTAMLARTIINKKQQLGLGVEKTRHRNRSKAICARNA